MGEEGWADGNSRGSFFLLRQQLSIIQGSPAANTSRTWKYVNSSSSLMPIQPDSTALESSEDLLARQGGAFRTDVHGFQGLMRLKVDGGDFFDH